MASLQERRNKDGVLISYKVMVYRGRDIDGKMLKPFISTFKVDPHWTEKTARKKAEAYAVNFERECKAGTATDARQTFSEYCAYVIGMKEERNTKTTTIARYKDLAERINSQIGYMKIRDIRPDTLNLFYSWLGQDGRNKKTGGRLSGKTVLEHHRLIHTVLQEAVREGVIPSNPADRVMKPKAEKPEVRYFQPEEIEAIRNALENEPIKWKALVHVMLVTGARRGEVLGLRWSDIDFDKNIISIERNVQYTVEKGVFVDSPKTANGYRSIAVPAGTMRILRMLKSWQGSEKMRTGMYYQDQGFLFTKEDGTPMHPDSVNRYLERFSKKYGLSRINPHAFRHSMASILYFNGADSVSISRRLGHAQVSTTTNIYAHLIEKADRENAQIIDDAFLKMKEKNG